jgi:hypothetical protein
MGYIAAGSTFVPATVGLVRYRKLTRPMKLFTAFSLVTCVNIALEFILGLFKIKNYFLSDIYYLIEVALLAFVYYCSLESRTSRKILLGCAIMFTAIWLVDEVCLANPGALNNTMAMITSFFLLVMSIYTLDAFLKTPRRQLLQEPMFWIVTATIVYSAGSFVVLGLSNELLKLGPGYFISFWHVNWILYAVSMMMYGKALLCRPQA